MSRLKGTCHWDMAIKFADALSKGQNKKITVVGGNTWFIREDRFKIGDKYSNIYIGFRSDFGWAEIKRCKKDVLEEQSLEILRQYNHWQFGENNFMCYINYYEDKDERINIVMELCNGNIETYAKEKWLSHQEKYRLIFEFLNSMEILHGQHLVHRFLKPSNLLISLNGKLRITDFSISRKVSVDTTSTKKSCTSGSQWWVSPPNIGRHSKDENQRTPLKKEDDIFVAMMLIFYILTNGQHPFCEFGSEGIIDFKRKTKNPEELCIRENCLMGVELPESLCQLFKEMFLKWMKDPTSVSLCEVKKEFLEFLYSNDTPGKRYAILLSHSSVKSAEDKSKRHALSFKENAILAEVKTSCAGTPTYEQLQHLTLEQAFIITKEMELQEQSQGDSLRSSTSDVALIRHVLQKCKFTVNALDGTSKEKLFKLLDDIKKDNNVENDEKVYIFMHIASHGYYDEDARDTYVQLSSEEYVAVKRIYEAVFPNLPADKFNLIFTADVCRKKGQHGGDILPDPSSPIFAMYSVTKDKVTAELDNFGTYFSIALARNIQPGRTLNEVVYGTSDELNKIDRDWFEPDIDIDNESLREFVF